ncbi:MAG: RNaseH2 domain-containing protein [Nitrospira sp.]|nr:MAG: RNaseH2 domain-containing protein [Nitrospira sp.]
MITSSFCLLPGVGLRTERRFWRHGILTWDRFLLARQVPGVSALRKALFDDRMREAQEHVVQLDSRYFARTLAARHQWRLYEWLRERALYLDIETDSFGQITVVGLYGQGRYTALVRNESLSLLRLREELSQYDLLITFCGSTFDLPMLRAHFSDLTLDQPHIDLCGIGRQLGYHGGLKAIERRMGINRITALQGFSGDDAVRQWNRWRHQRDEGARELLLAYNEADCVNLQPLADALYCRLVVASGLEEARGQQGLDPATYR